LLVFPTESNNETAYGRKTNLRAVGIADIFRIPKIVVGIVLVSLATSLPEFSVSVQAAYLGHSEIALGNPVGSVIANNGLALALAAIIGVSIVVDRHILKSFGIFLICSAYYILYFRLRCFYWKD